MKKITGLFLLGCVILFGLGGAYAVADDQHFGFVVMGDSRGPGPGDSEAEQIAKDKLVRLRDKIASLNSKLTSNKVDFVVFGGDMCRGGGATRIEMWKNLMDQMGIKYIVAKGNHEMPFYKTKTDENPAINEQYQNEFAARFNGSLPAGSSSRQDWKNNLAFSFNYGNSFFAILDLYYADPEKGSRLTRLSGQIGDKQLKWLETRLQEAQGQMHRFVFGHAPLDCDSCDDNTKIDPQTKKVIEINYPDLRRTLRENFVDVYFAGHDHVFSWKTSKTHSSAPRPQKDVLHIITGKAGAADASRSDPCTKSSYKNHYFGCRAFFHFLYVRVDGAQCRIYAYDDSGTLFYQFTNGTRQDPPIPPTDILPTPF